jgi:hypothetical protein
MNELTQSQQLIFPSLDPAPKLRIKPVPKPSLPPQAGRSPAQLHRHEPARSWHSSPQSITTQLTGKERGEPGSVLFPLLPNCLNAN